MKKIFVAIAIVFILLPISRVSAKIVFTEIMYGSSSDWVEVYNDGSQDVDLSKYYLYSNYTGTSSTRHYVKQVLSKSTIIPAGGYAIIANDGEGFSVSHSDLVVLDTIISLSTSTQSSLILTTDSVKPPINIEDQAVCDPSICIRSDGNSLQKKSDGTWIYALPTAGSVNTESQNNNSENNSTSTDTSNQNITYGTGGGSSSLSVSNSQKSPEPKTILSVPKIAIAGVSIDIGASIINNPNNSSYEKAFHVALGDGTEHNSYSDANFSHIYKYPGTYVVYFTYQTSAFDKPIFSAHQIIEVVAPNVVISGLEKDGAIKVTNNGSRETDISDWKICSLIDPNISFSMPKNTNILAGKTITLPEEVSGILSQNTKKLFLSLPLGHIVSIYDNTN